MDEEELIEQIKRLAIQLTDSNERISKALLDLYSSKVQASSVESHIRFLFSDNFYAVEVHRNGSMEALTDSNGIEKFPMYLSMAEGGILVLGEKAKSHCEKFPQYVIYGKFLAMIILSHCLIIIFDVLKIIGKRLEEIKLNPKWGFKLTEKDDMVCFQVETPAGARSIPQELVVGAFMKDMKRRAGLSLNAEIKEVDVSANFQLTDPQKEIFKKAAAKINLQISSFVVNNRQ